MGFDLGSLGGGLAGGALGLLGGGSHPAGSTTTTANQDLPAWLKPYVTGNLQNAQNAFGNINQYAIPEYERTLQGDYLNPSTNPYLDMVYKHAAGLVGADVDSRFAGSGRYGSGAHQGVLAEKLGGLASNLFGQNYQSERARQAAAAAGAPSFFFSPYQLYASLFPNLKNTATTEPYFTNPLGNALSMGLLGSQLGSGLFGGGGSPAGLLGSEGQEGAAGYEAYLGGSGAGLAGTESLADLLAAGVIAL